MTLPGYLRSPIVNDPAVIIRAAADSIVRGGVLVVFPDVHTVDGGDERGVHLTPPREIGPAVVPIDGIPINLGEKFQIVIAIEGDAFHDRKAWYARR